MSDKKVIYSKGDVLFTVKTTEGKGSGVRATPPLPKKCKFKVDIYLRDGRTFTYIAPADYFHYNDDEILEEAMLKTALYIYCENPNMIVYPTVNYCVISTCQSYRDWKMDREKWECCYWSNGKYENATIASCITDFIASSVDRTVDWDVVMRKVVKL